MSIRRSITPGPLDALRFNAWLGDQAPNNSMSRAISAYRSSGTNTFATLWGRTSGSFTFLTTGIKMAFVSGSASDSSAGVGARTILAVMIDENWDIVTETITMNGTTRVPTTASNIIALKYAKVLTTGSSIGNVGEITMVDNAAGTTVYATMSATHGDTRDSQCWMAVEKGSSAILTELNVVNLTNPATRGLLRLNVYQVQTSGGTNFVNHRRGILYAANQRMFPNGFYIPEKSIVWGEQLVATAGNEVSGGFSILSTPFS